MALPVSNTAEGGSDETTVTTGNSGGASGNAFDVVDISGTGAELVFDSARSAHGGLSYRVTNGSVGGTQRLRYTSTSLGSFTECWGRVYLYQTALAASGEQVVRINDSGQTRLAMLLPGVAADQKLYVRANLPGTQQGGTVNISLNQWVRLEWHFICHNTTGLIEAKLFNTPDSTTADDTVTLSNVDTDNGSGVAEQVDFGHGVNANLNSTLWIDDMNVNATGYPGPATTTAQWGRRQSIGSISS